MQQDWKDSFKNKLNDKSSLRQWTKSFDLAGQKFNPTFLIHFLKSFSRPGQIWGLFNPIQNEPRIDFVSMKDLNLEFTYPKVTDQGMVYCSSNFIFNDLNTNIDDFEVSSLGVLEPKNGEPVEPSLISGLIIPGLVFDHRGFRLGRGKSYYDKYLKNFTGLKIGLTWSHFFIPAPIPKDDWDIAMDFIVTEKFLYQPTASVTSSQVTGAINSSVA